MAIDTVSLKQQWDLWEELKSTSVSRKKPESIYSQNDNEPVAGSSASLVNEENRKRKAREAALLESTEEARKRGRFMDPTIEQLLMFGPVDETFLSQIMNNTYAMDNETATLNLNESFTQEELSPSLALVGPNNRQESTENINSSSLDAETRAKSTLATGAKENRAETLLASENRAEPPVAIENGTEPPLATENGTEPPLLTENKAESQLVSKTRVEFSSPALKAKSPSLIAPENKNLSAADAQISSTRDSATSGTVNFDWSTISVPQIPSSFTVPAISVRWLTVTVDENERFVKVANLLDDFDDPPMCEVYRSYVTDFFIRNSTSAATDAAGPPSQCLEGDKSELSQIVNTRVPDVSKNIHLDDVLDQEASGNIIGPTVSCSFEQSKKNSTNKVEKRAIIPMALAEKANVDQVHSNEPQNSCAVTVGDQQIHSSELQRRIQDLGQVVMKKERNERSNSLNPSSENLAAIVEEEALLVTKEEPSDPSTMARYAPVESAQATETEHVRDLDFPVFKTKTEGLRIPSAFVANLGGSKPEVIDISLSSDEEDERNIPSVPKSTPIVKRIQNDEDSSKDSHSSTPQSFENNLSNQIAQNMPSNSRDTETHILPNANIATAEGQNLNACKAAPGAFNFKEPEPPTVNRQTPAERVFFHFVKLFCDF